jgi:hypothetical protein
MNDPEGFVSILKEVNPRVVVDFIAFSPSHVNDVVRALWSDQQPANTTSTQVTKPTPSPIKVSRHQHHHHHHRHHICRHHHCHHHHLRRRHHHCDVTAIVDVVAAIAIIVVVITTVVKKRTKRLCLPWNFLMNSFLCTDGSY